MLYPGYYVQCTQDYMPRFRAVSKILCPILSLHPGYCLSSIALHLVSYANPQFYTKVAVSSVSSLLCLTSKAASWLLCPYPQCCIQKTASSSLCKSAPNPLLVYSTYMPDPYCISCKPLAQCVQVWAAIIYWSARSIYLSARVSLHIITPPPPPTLPALIVLQPPAYMEYLALPAKIVFSMIRVSHVLKLKKWSVKTRILAWNVITWKIITEKW